MKRCTFACLTLSKADGAKTLLAALDPGIRRRSFPARVDRVARETFEESTTRASDRPTDRHADCPSGGLGRPPPPQLQQLQRKPLALRERKRRRRKRQQRSRQEQPLRSDYLGSQHGSQHGDDGYGGSNGDSHGVDERGTTQAADEDYPATIDSCAATTGPPGPVGRTGDSKASKDGSNDSGDGVTAGVEGKGRGRPTFAIDAADCKAQQKSPGAEREEGGLECQRREVTFKPVARQRDHIPRGGSSGGADISEPRSEENVQVMGREGGLEHPHVGGARARGSAGGIEDRGKGFESRAAAAGESRFRRTRRKKSQEFKKRGGGGGGGSGSSGGSAVMPGRSDNGAIVTQPVRASGTEPRHNMPKLCMPTRGSHVARLVDTGTHVCENAGVSHRCRSISTQSTPSRRRYTVMPYLRRSGEAINVSWRKSPRFPRALKLRYQNNLPCNHDPGARHRLLAR